MFTNLPLEIKLYIIELDPLHLIDLLLVDRSIYEYYSTEEGKNWHKRILQIRVIDTDKEKGTTILNSLKHGEWKYYGKGKLTKSVWYKLGLKNGLEHIYYFKNNQVKRIIPYIKNIIVGTVIIYYNNGDVESEIDYNNEIRHGKCVKYHRGNKIKSQCTYNNGELEGKCAKYYDNGNIHFLTNYKNGKIHGSYTYGTYEGLITSRTEYTFGRMTQEQYFDKNGLCDVIVYDEHKRIEKKYNSQLREVLGRDVLISENLFEYHKHVKSTGYDSDGNKTRETIYEVNKIVSEKIYVNGQLVDDKNYYKGELHGTHRTYYNNGNPKHFLEFNNGKLDGIGQKWTSDGKICSETIYKLGRIITEKTYNDKERIVITHKGTTYTEKKYLLDNIVSKKTYKNGKLTKEKLYNNNLITVNLYDELNRRINTKVYDDKYLIAESFYNNNLLHGECYEYYVSGETKSIKMYHRGLLQGITVDFHENKRIKKNTPYVNGMIHGIVSEYSVRGNLEKEQIYSLGKQVNL